MSQVEEWDDAEVDTHAPKGDRSVRVIELVRNNRTGEVRERATSIPMLDGAPQTYIYEGATTAATVTETSSSTVTKWMSISRAETTDTA